MRILRHDKVSTGNDDDHIRGIVFDGAWLWEEYLATLLKPMCFEHPENKTGKGKRYLFTDNKTGKIFPDFIGENSVLDAKYKQLDVNNIPREDRFQLISYMHVLQKDLGVLLYPTRSDCAIKPNKELHGDGGEMGTLAFCVPQDSDRMDFYKSLQDAEKVFCQNVFLFSRSSEFGMEPCKEV